MLFQIDIVGDRKDQQQEESRLQYSSYHSSDFPQTLRIEKDVAETDIVRSAGLMRQVFLVV